MNVKSFSKKLYIILLSLILFYGSFVGFSSLRTVKADTQTEYVIEAGEYEFRETLTDFSSESIYDFHFSFPVIFLGEQYSYIHFDRYENYYGEYSFLSGWSDSTGPVAPVRGFYDCLSSSWLVSARNFTVLSDISTSADFYNWFMSNIVQPEPEPEPEPVVGVLNMAYEFFYTWLWGESPNVTFAPYADSITLFIALFFVVLMAYFAFRLVTGLIKLIYYLFDVRK